MVAGWLGIKHDSLVVHAYMHGKVDLHSPMKKQRPNHPLRAPDTVTYSATIEYADCLCVNHANRSTVKYITLSEYDLRSVEP